MNFEQMAPDQDTNVINHNPKISPALGRTESGCSPCPLRQAEILALFCFIWEKKKNKK